MGDLLNSENLLFTQEHIDWYFRKKTIWEKIKEFFCGKETVESHFGEENYAPCAWKKESEE